MLSFKRSCFSSFFECIYTVTQADVGRRAGVAVVTNEEVDAAGAIEDDCFAIRQAMREVSKRFDRYLQPAGLKTTQFSLMRRLASRGPMSSTSLAVALVLDRTTLVRAMAPLLREELIEQNPRMTGEALRPCS